MHFRRSRGAAAALWMWCAVVAGQPVLHSPCAHGVNVRSMTRGDHHHMQTGGEQRDRGKSRDNCTCFGRCNHAQTAYLPAGNVSASLPPAVRRAVREIATVERVVSPLQELQRSTGPPVAVI